MDMSISLSINSNTPIVSGITPLPDGGQTAYSIARIIPFETEHTGAIIRVRRSSDNLELDISTSGGNLDETALLAHTGAGDGFVVTAYDQTANTNDWVTANAAAQSKIVSSGVVEKVNGKPAIFSGSSDYLRVLGITGGSATTAFHVISSASTSRITIGSNDGAAYYGIATSGNVSDNYNNAGTPAIYVNGSSIGSTRGDLYTALDGIQAINTYTGLDLSYVGWSNFQTLYKTLSSFEPHSYIQETIIYDSDKSANRTAIETNINDYYTIY